MAGPVVALVLVSHSELLSRGVAEVAAQMAPDVLLLPAGGTGDGRIGTGVEVIESAIGRALEGGRSAVVLTDLGSAALSAETVLELAEPEVAARVRIVDAPLVEGAVEAAVVAQTGADLGTVVEAAEDAAKTFARAAGALSPAGPAGPVTRGGPAGAAAGGPGEAAAGGGAPGEESGSGRSGRSGEAAGSPQAPGFAVAVDVATGGMTSGSAGVAGPTRATEDLDLRAAGAGAPGSHGRGPVGQTRSSRAAGVPTARGTAVLRNRLGLHARPAAQLVRTVSAFDALVTVNGVDARSILALVGLGATGGQEVVVAATGPQARHAVNAVVDELENGFGEA